MTRKSFINFLKYNWLGLLAALLIFIVIAFNALGCFTDSKTNNFVLIITALVIIWYTVETTKIRRDAESRSEKELKPVFYFDLKLRNNKLEQDISKLGPADLVRAGIEFQIRFLIINHTANPAYLRVLIRLKTSSGQSAIEEHKPYDGKRVWHITPFFNLDGWFDLIQLINDAQIGKAANTWPDSPMTINLQVDIYDVHGYYLNTERQEFAVKIDFQSNIVKLWPNIDVCQIEPVRPSKNLPKNLLLADLKEE